MIGPLRFTPFLRPLVWGGRRLGDLLHKQLPTADAVGESWEVSDHASHRSVVAAGPWRGQTLRQLMERTAPDLLGRENSPTIFPWLIKFLDACDWLSVQVHPDDERARRLSPGEGGKTEAWFVLAAEPDSRVYAGLLPGVDEARLWAALRDGTVGACLHQFRPRPGDCLFLKAGTVHAVGGGVLMAEIQQTSDATYRLFDWDRCDAQGRSRALHIEEAIACIDWQGGPVAPIRVEGFVDGDSGRAVRQRLVTCPFFTLDFVGDSVPFSVGGAHRLQALIVVQGRGRLPALPDHPQLERGDTVVLPATLPAVVCEPEGRLGVLLATLP